MNPRTTTLLSGLLCALTLPLFGGTIGHWRFEDSADLGLDSGPAGRHLTLSSGPTAAALGEDGPGSAFYSPLPGTSTNNAGAATFSASSLATAADNDAFTDGTFSIEVYAHPSTNPGTSQFMVGHFNGTTNRRSWGLLIRDGKLALYLSSSGTSQEEFYSDAPVTAGSDYYLAATVDAANTASGGVTLYVQNLTEGGALVAKQFTHTTTSLHNSNTEFSLGATGGGTSHFVGLLDEVRLSDTKLAAAELLAIQPEVPSTPELPVANGFKGIWYYIGPTPNYGYKYSGGMATYPHQHAPIAIYAPAVNKTFFVYGGTNAANSTLLHMISYYDHTRKQVARPRQLVNKATTDAHDNPVLSIDGDGYLWVFSNTHGNNRRSYLWKSVDPYDITRFTEITLPTDVFPQTRFSYGNPWYIPGQGFFFFHTRYNSADRDLYYTTSPDGISWTTRKALAQMLGGQYQISNRFGNKLATVFDVHPGSADTRTNLYYLETPDMGATWRNAAGTTVTAPLTNVTNPALIYNYAAENLLVYFKDLQFDSAGRPVILYLTASTYQPGPLNPPRMLRTARWTGTEWLIRDVFPTDHNYDMGSLYVESDNLWRIIAPYLDGPQQYGTGGEMAIWTSVDQGQTWQLQRQLTSGSAYNHSFSRRPLNARDEFYALWADGNAFASSVSHLYFTNRYGDAVFRLPDTMTTDLAYPELVTMADPAGDPDGDGTSTQSEFEAGTDPRDTQSVLRLLSTATGTTFAFPTVPGKLYDTWYSETLATWEPLDTALPGTGNLLEINDPTAAGEPQRFYKVGLSQ